MLYFKIKFANDNNIFISSITEFMAGEYAKRQALKRETTVLSVEQVPKSVVKTNGAKALDNEKKLF